MTQTYVIYLYLALGVILFLALLYLIIRLNIYVNSLQKEFNELHLYLPGMIRDVRQELKNLNNKLATHIEQRQASCQQMGFLAGKLFIEIIFSRFKFLKFNKKKMLFFSVIMKFVDFKKKFYSHL